MSQENDTGALMALIRNRELEQDNPLYYDYNSKLFIDSDTQKILDEKVKYYPYFEQLITVRHKLFINEMYNLLNREKDVYQIVSIGAGYCSIVNEIMKSSNRVRGFEIDKENVLSLKKSKIKYLPSAIPFEITEKNNQFSEKLLKAGFKRDSRSIFVMEGFLYYLKNMNIIEGVFNQINSLMSFSSFLLFDMQLGNNSYEEKEKDFENIWYRLSTWNELLNKYDISVLKFGNIAYLDEWNRLTQHRGEVKSGFFLTGKYGDKIS
jgi:O-methyltransferase involved in polyketide biosynthesis